MKTYSLFLALSLAVPLSATETYLERYTELRNNSNIAKMEAYRNIKLKEREDYLQIRDYKDILRTNRSQAIYAKVDKNYTLNR